VGVPFVSLIISTRDRAESLRRTFASLVGQLPLSDWELIAVDNGSVDHTASALCEFQERLPLITLFEPTAGKCRALNRALEIVRGDLVVFTDDDVKVSSNWLREFSRGYVTYGDGSVFCGPIVPVFPAPVPDWLRTHVYAQLAFSRFEWPLREGLLPAAIMPFGPNYAVRRQAVREMRFREDLGPASDGLLNDETEFCKRLRTRGDQFYFLPGASVEHYVRPEQLTLPWLFERGFRLGRSLVVEQCGPQARVRSSERNEREDFEAAMGLNILCGYVAEFLKCLGITELYTSSESQLNAFTGSRGRLLAPSAAKILASVTSRNPTIRDQNAGSQGAAEAGPSSSAPVLCQNPGRQ
jgi:glycosyltransferase involved in cell wall biosynthesis